MAKDFQDRTSVSGSRDSLYEARTQRAQSQEGRPPAALQDRINACQILETLLATTYGTMWIIPTGGPAGDTHVFKLASSIVTKSPKSFRDVSDLISASLRPGAFTT